MLTTAGCSGGGAFVAAPSQSGISSSSTSTTSAGASPTPAPVRSNTAITLDRSSRAGAIVPMFVGLSYEKATLSTTLFSSGDPSLIDCFKRLGTSVLRIGGSSVDKTTWSALNPGLTTGQVAPSDISRLAAFLQATGWKIIYGINLASNSPLNAASEAAFAKLAFGDSLYGFEIGNECDLYASQGYRTKGYSVSDLVSEWSQYALAIRAVVPDAPLTGPACITSVDRWAVPFAQAVGDELTALTQHYYRQPGYLATSTMSLLLAGDPALPPELQALASAAKASNLANGFRISECNSFSSSGTPGVSDAYGSALWAIDFALTCASNGASGLNFHGGSSGPGYTPISDYHDAVRSVRPMYYGLLLVSQLASGPMYPVKVATDLLLSAYGVAGDDGATYVVIVNKEASKTATVELALGSTAHSAKSLTLAGPSLSSTTGVTLGGAGVSSDGAWSPKYTNVPVSGASIDLRVAPSSAILLRIA